MNPLTVFVPNRKIIQNITNANPAIVTVTEDHGYHPGIFVRIVIPYLGSMFQIDGKVFLIDILSPTTFAVPIDSTNFAPFVLAPLKDGVPIQQAQVIPVGEFITLDNAVNNVGPRNP